MKEQPSRPENSRQRAAIRKVINTLSDEENNKLSAWVSELISIQKSNLPKKAKAKEALRVTKKSGIGKTTFKVFFQVSKKGGQAGKSFWNNRSISAKIGLSTAAATVAVFGTQGAGIAALGTAIGLPLWMVTGAGAMFASTLFEELKQKDKNEEVVYFVPSNDD